MSAPFTATAPVTSTIVVQATVEHAFETFTTGIGAWWPADKHIMQVEVAEMVFEPRVGGRIFDRGVDGSESAWARVLVYEPPTRVVFSWDIGLDWQIETDPARTSEVEVRFTTENGGRTRVELEHRKLERHGEGWDAMRAAVGSPNGWPSGLEAFAEHMRG